MRIKPNLNILISWLSTYVYTVSSGRSEAVKGAFWQNSFLVAGSLEKGSS